MQHQNYEQWNNAARKIQEPLQAMAELNIKTLQNLEYLKPEDLAKIKKPDELLEKQINLIVKNGHNVLDYMQKSFQIFESALVNFVHESKKAVDQVKK